jgi:hypothetical protein
VASMDSLQVTVLSGEVAVRSLRLNSFQIQSSYNSWQSCCSGCEKDCTLLCCQCLLTCWCCNKLPCAAVGLTKTVKESTVRYSQRMLPMLTDTQPAYQALGSIMDLKQACTLTPLLGVFATRERVRQNKSGIAHRGRTGINHLRELPTKFNHFCSGGQVTLPNRTREPQVCLWSAGAEKLGWQPVIPKSRAAFINLEKQVIPRADLGAQNGGLSYETVC